MEFCCKNILKIRNVTFIFKCFENLVKNILKNWNNSYGFWKISINNPDQSGSPESYSSKNDIYNDLQLLIFNFLWFYRICFSWNIWHGNFIVIVYDYFREYSLLNNLENDKKILTVERLWQFFLVLHIWNISYYHSHGKPVIITRIIMLIFRKTGHKHLSLGCY